MNLTVCERYFLSNLNPKTQIFTKNRPGYFSPTSGVAVGAKYNDFDEVKRRIEHGFDVIPEKDIDAIFFAYVNCVGS